MLRLAPGSHSPMIARKAPPLPTWESGIGNLRYSPLPAPHSLLPTPRSKRRQRTVVYKRRNFAEKVPLFTPPHVHYLKPATKDLDVNSQTPNSLRPRLIEGP